MAYVYGETPPEMGYFFMLQVYDGVGRLLNEVYERVGKSVISVCKKAQKDQQLHFMAVKMSRKHSGLVIYSYLKDNAITAVKRNAEFRKVLKVVNFARLVFKKSDWIKCSTTII